MNSTFMKFDIQRDNRSNSMPLFGNNILDFTLRTDCTYERWFRDDKFDLKTVVLISVLICS